MRRAVALCMLTIVGCAACADGRPGSARVARAGMSENQAVQVLTKLGYTHITGIRKRGSHWLGTADKDGQQVTFDLDRDGDAVDFILSKTVR